MPGLHTTWTSWDHPSNRSGWADRRRAVPLRGTCRCTRQNPDLLGRDHTFGAGELLCRRTCAQPSQGASHASTANGGRRLSSCGHHSSPSADVSQLRNGGRTQMANGTRTGHTATRRQDVKRHGVRRVQSTSRACACKATSKEEATMVTTEGHWCTLYGAVTTMAQVDKGKA